MSYDIDLKDRVTGETIKLDAVHQIRGGTYCVGGTALAELNITYNYGRFYREYNSEEGIRCIYGLTGAESIPVLNAMIEVIKSNHPGMETSENYWEPCAGNAVRSLYQLLAFAQLRPDGVWDGD